VSLAQPEKGAGLVSKVLKILLPAQPGKEGKL